MSKKRVSLALGLLCIASFCLSACSSNNTTTSGDSDKTKEYSKIISDAAEKLNSTYNDYIVTNTLNAPDGDTQYIEVMHGGVSYTEYSVDSDNNLGTLPYASAESIQYTLTDWMTEDGKYYLFSADAEGKAVIYQMNDTYTSYVEDRSHLYVNKMLENAISVTDYDDITLNLGEGDETFTCYKIKVKGESIKDILGVSSYGIYKSYMDDKDTDANIAKLCGYYLEDLTMNLTFSDANVIVGIDNNGILKYVCLEAGGLGTRLYFTKAVVATKNTNLRDTPDVTSAVPFSDSLKELADYVASYDTYEEALKAMNGVVDGVPEGVESTEEPEPTEVPETTDDADEPETTEEPTDGVESTEEPETTEPVDEPETTEEPATE